MTITTLHQPKDSASPLGKALQEVLANTYGLFLATHNYHWNVEGANFVALHKLFDEQVNELFTAIDSIAERIRAIGDYALPFEGDNITQLFKLTSNPLNKETEAAARANRMIQNLVSLHVAVISSCQAAKAECKKQKDEESENVMVERITVHQKALWMLNSSLKQ